MKHIIMYSSGVGSWAAAKRVVEKYGKSEVILLFADTLIEDEDNYRFLDESAQALGCELIKLAEGRDPWQVFFDKRWLGNSRVAQCSHVLKQKPCRDWLKQNDPNHEAIVYVGVDWSEQHRMKSIRENYRPWTALAPMTEPPYLDKVQVLNWIKAEGLEPPRLYSKGFSHANCGGFCPRGGQAHFANLLKQFPLRYAYHEGKEEELRQFLDADVSILQEEVKGEKRCLTLRAFRERIELKPTQYDLFDWGGCGCFSAPTSEEVQEERKAA